MKKPLHWIGGAILLAGIGVSNLAGAEPTALGGGQPGPRQIPFEEMDQNKDGKVTLEEHRQFHEEKSRRWFQDMDQNQDGAVTKEEIQSAQGRHRPPKFEDLDANKDGQISQQEFEAGRVKQPTADEKKI